MKEDTSFRTPYAFGCFIIGIINGLFFYALVKYGLYQLLQWPVGRMIGWVQCITYILFFWGLAILLVKWGLLRHERLALRLMQRDFQSSKIISKRSEVDQMRGEILRGDQGARIRRTALVNTLLFLIDHCLVTETSQRVVEIFKARLDTLQKRIDSSYSMLNYIAWAIPSFGFIGTVLGIGDALAQAEGALDNLALVTAPLGMAFDTTFIALVASVILMFFVHLMQHREEDLLSAIDLFCQEKFIINLRLG